MSDELRYRLTIDAGQATAGLTTLNQKLGETERATTSWVDRFARLGFARQGISAITSSIEQMQRALAGAEQHQRAVQALGVAFDQVSQATRGAVSAEQAHQASMALSESGLRVSTEQLVAITRRAREYALATGRETPDALRDLTQALVNGEAGGLRRYGVALMDGTRRTDAFRQATGRWIDEQRNVPAAAQTASEGMAGLGRSLESLASGMINSAVDAGRWWGRLLGIINDTRAAAGAGGLAGEEENVRAQGRARVNATLQRAGLTPEQIGRMDAYARGTAAFNLNRGAGLQQVLEAIPGLRRENQLNVQDARVRQLEQEGLDAAYGQGGQSGGGGGGGGGSSTNPLATLTASISRILAAQGRIRDFTGPQGPGANTQRMPGEPLAAYATRISNLAQALEETAQRYEQQSQADQQRYAANRQFSEQHSAAVSGAQRDLAAASSRAHEQAGLSRRAGALGGLQQESLDQLVRSGGQLTEETVRNAERMGDAAYQFNDRFRDVLHSTATLSMQSATLVRGAFDSMTQGFRSHLGALLEGRENIGEALRGMLHETLMNLAQESAVRAIFEYASGFASLASQNYVSAAQHFTSAGIFTGVAVLAGAGAALTTPAQVSPNASQGGGASRGGLAERAPRAIGDGASAAENGAMVFNITVGSAIATREEVGDTVRRAADFAGARASVPILVRNIENMRAA